MNTQLNYVTKSRSWCITESYHKVTGKKLNCKPTGFPDAAPIAPAKKRNGSSTIEL